MSSTLGTLITLVSRKLGDRVVGEYYSENEIKDTIGEAYRYYTQKLVGLSAGYFETTVMLDIVANSPLISTASFTPPFWIVSQLWRQVTFGFYPLRPSENRYNADYTLGSGTGDAYLPTYKLKGQNIYLTPTPLFSQTAGLKLDYVYQPTFPNYTSSSLFTFDANFPAIYETNVIIRSAIKLMESKDAIGGVSDIGTFRSELAELDRAFEETMTPDENPDSVSYMGRDYRYIY